MSKSNLKKAALTTTAALAGATFVGTNKVHADTVATSAAPAEQTTQTADQQAQSKVDAAQSAANQAASTASQAKETLDQV